MIVKEFIDKLNEIIEEYPSLGNLNVAVKQYDCLKSNMMAFVQTDSGDINIQFCVKGLENFRLRVALKNFQNYTIAQNIDYLIKEKNKSVLKVEKEYRDEEARRNFLQNYK